MPDLKCLLRPRPLLFLPWAMVGALIAWPATAQDGGRPGTATSEAAEAGPVFTGPIDLTVTTTRKRRCGQTGPGGEIVVCGADHGDDVRVPSTADSDPDSREGQNTGIPQAPNVSGLPDCRKGCIGLGKAPARVFIIDVKNLPEAPKGSDAEKVANGEISDR